MAEGGECGAETLVLQLWLRNGGDAACPAGHGASIVQLPAWEVPIGEVGLFCCGAVNGCRKPRVRDAKRVRRERLAEAGPALHGSRWTAPPATYRVAPAAQTLALACGCTYRRCQRVKTGRPAPFDAKTWHGVVDELYLDVPMLLWPRSRDYVLTRKRFLD